MIVSSNKMFYGTIIHHFKIQINTTSFCEITGRESNHSNEQKVVPLGFVFHYI
jgi:hypothetical protein